MGLVDKIFGKKEPELKVAEYFKMLNAYTPVFTSFEGSVYEMDLTRSVIHSFATHVSKLNMEVKGKANVQLGKQLKTKANPWMDSSKYLYRLATIYSVANNAFIVPMYDPLTDKVNGYYPVQPDSAEIIESMGKIYVRFTFGGQKRAIELENVGIINQYQYRDDFFGDSNKTMQPTLELLNTQNEGIIEGVKSSATIRFMAKLANVLRDEDLRKEQKRFSDMNLSSTNSTGVMVFDNKYQDVKQIISKPYTVNAEQMRDIKDSVFTHFGTNEDILQNKYSSDGWSAYYEGVIEPFAIKASLAHTNLTFSDRELANDNFIMLTANRLQYLSNSEKLSTVTQLFDRGFLTHNEGREIFNMTGIDDGDKYYIRKEYSETQKLDGGSDDIQGEIGESTISSNGVIDGEQPE